MSPAALRERAHQLRGDALRIEADDFAALNGAFDEALRLKAQAAELETQAALLEAAARIAITHNEA